MTPEKVKQGVAEVREGLAFCLSMPLDYPGGSILNPRRNPPVLSPTQRSGKPNMAYPLSRDDPKLIDVVCDDVVLLTLQYSTQWDSLAHVGQQFDVDGDGKPEMVFYNGFRAGEHIVGPVDYRGGKEVATAGHAGATKLGIENMAATGVQGRAVMIDLHAHYGRERRMVGYEDLMGILEKDKVTVEQGDFVCLRTGFDRMLLEFDRKPDESIHHRLRRARRARRPAAAMGDRRRSRRADLRQLRGRGASLAAVRRRCLRLAAAARALPVPARRLSRRALVPERACRLAARAQAQPLPAHRAAAAAARRGRLAGDAGRHGLNLTAADATNCG